MATYVLDGQKYGPSLFGTAGGGNVTWTADGSVPAAFIPVIRAALADWAKYANIAFTQVASIASAKISFFDSFIDGVGNVLGDTTYSYSGTTFRATSIDFDSGEGWSSSGSTVLSSEGVNLFVVALHEIGHLLGLYHYNDALAVMNSYLHSQLGDLTRSDIDGIQATTARPESRSRPPRRRCSAPRCTMLPAPAGKSMPFTKRCSAGHRI